MFGVWVGGDKLFLGFRGDDLDVDVVGAGKEESLTNWEVGETFLFFVGEFEDVREDIDGGSGLFEQELHGRVGDDSATHFGAHKIFDVLSDGSKAEIVFASAFGEGEEEVGGIVVLHELPSLIDDEETTLLLGADDIPDVRQDNIHGDGAELVFQIANVEDDHGVVDIYIRLLREDASESAGGVFAQAVSKRGAVPFHMKECVVEVDDGGGSGLVSERVRRDAGASVSVN